MEMKTGYRTPGMPHGSFGRLGALHVHIDGTKKSEERVLNVLQSLEERGYPGKITYVEESVAGQQEEHHEKDIDFYTTTLIADPEKAGEVLNFIDTRLGTCYGLLVDLERVVAKFGYSLWRDAEYKENENVFEVHHIIEIPKVAMPAEKMPALQKLKNFCEEQGIEFERWFLVENHGRFTYLSSACSKGEYKALAEIEHYFLMTWLGEKAPVSGCRTTTVVESMLKAYSLE